MLAQGFLRWHLGWQLGHLKTLAFSSNTPKHSGSLRSFELPVLQSLIYYRAGGLAGGGGGRGGEGGWCGWAHSGPMSPASRALPPPPALDPSMEEMLNSSSCMRDILIGLHSCVSLLHMGFVRVIYKQEKLK